MDLLRRQPLPPLDQRFGGQPNTDLDRLILQTMRERTDREQWTAHQVVRATGARDKDVWRRLNLLIRRGVLLRSKVPDGPDRGPGSYTYSLPSGRSGTSSEF